MSFDDLISYENIYIAFKRLQTTSRDYYKNLYWNDLYNFGLDLEKNINTLIHLLKEDLYKPNKSYKIYFPKSTGLVRPISVLNFIDLLVYQAIVNLLAEKFYKSFHSYYNHFVFGNIYNKTNNENKIFFYKHWKQQWKKYENLTKQHYNDGYEYITEFDLASFYDTVDHYLVKNLLKEKNIDKKIIDILSSQLLSWNKNQTQNQGFKHGIPQGPLGSGFIAEICLHNIDKKMRKLVLENRNIRYMRYVDDIRIFTKDKYLAQKNIVYLDLLARELGFIPQANKTKVKKVDNIHLYIKTNKDFSRVASEYKEKGELSPSNNRKYTKRLIKNLKSGNYDKTLIKFGLFKVKGNEELKNLLIDKYKDLYPYIEAVSFYLSKYFINDKKVIEWVNNLIYDCTAKSLK